MATLSLVIGTLISPIVGIISLFISLLKRHQPKLATTILLSLIFALIGIYWFPWGDNQSHFHTYIIDNVSYYLGEPLIMIGSSYWFYDWVIRFLAGITGNYVYGYFFWLFFPLAIYSSVVWSSHIKNVSKRGNYLIPYFLLFMVIGIREFLDLNRSTAASLLLIAGLFLLKGNFFAKTGAIFLFVMTFYLHDMCKFIIILLPVVYWQLNRINSNVTWYTIAVLLIILSAVIQTWILPNILSERNQELYLGGTYGTGSGVNSGFMVVMGWINVLLVPILYYYIIKRRKYIRNKLVLCLFLSSSLIVFSCFGLWTIRERFSILCILSAISLIVSEWDLFYSKRILKKILISSVIIKFCIVLSLHYSALFIHHSSSNNPKESITITSRILYIPSPILFDVNTFGYNDKAYIKLYNRAKYGI